MRRIAVDVALLPPLDVMEKAISLNKELVEKFGSRIRLDKKTCIPHITLAMGCVDESDLPQIRKKLQPLVEKYLPQEVLIDGTVVPPLPNAAYFTVGKTPQLQGLHEDVMNELKEFLSYDVEKEMFFNPADVTERTLRWVVDYPLKSSFEQFKPHLTLGYGEKADDVHLIFRAFRLAVCQLGSSCTCRKILFDFEVKEKKR